MWTKDAKLMFAAITQQQSFLCRIYSAALFSGLCPNRREACVFIRGWRESGVRIAFVKIDSGE